MCPGLFPRRWLSYSSLVSRHVRRWRPLLQRYSVRPYASDAGTAHGSPRNRKSMDTPLAAPSASMPQWGWRWDGCCCWRDGCCCRPCISAHRGGVLACRSIGLQYMCVYVCVRSASGAELRATCCHLVRVVSACRRRRSTASSAEIIVTVEITVVSRADCGQPRAECLSECRLSLYVYCSHPSWSVDHTRCSP